MVYTWYVFEKVHGNNHLNLTRRRKTMEKLLLSAKEAQEIFSISKWSLYRLASRGEIPSVKIGGLRRFPQKALEKVLMGEYFEKR